MINKKTALILLLVVVLLGALTAFVFMWDGPSDNSQDELYDDGSIVIFNGDADKLVSIDVNMPEQTYTIAKTENGWTLDGVENELVMSYAIDSLAYNVSSISAKSIVEENPDNLGQYGLSAAKYSIVANYEDGKKTFYAGDKTAMGDGYYFKDADSPVVYTVYSSDFSSLFKEKSDYMDISLLRVNVEKLNKISINTGKTFINLKLLDEPLVMDGYTIANWEMTEPVKLTVDSSQLSEEIIQKLSSFGADSIVSDKGDFSTYGLDSPYATVTLSDSDGVTQTMNISSCTGNKYYVSKAGSKLVYSVDASSLDFIDIDPFKIVNKFVNIVFIDEIDKVVVKSKEAEYTLSVSDQNGKKYLFNGVNTDEKRFKTELYQSVVGLVCSGFCNDAVYTNPDVTIEYYMANGAYTKAEFVNYDDRNYAVFKDGTCIFRILKKDVNTVLEALKNFK